MKPECPVVIVGGGLSGLYAAWQLQQNKIPVVVLEARDRIGGRILSPRLNEHDKSAIDLGPAWVWPDFQPKIAGLLNELNIDLFKQYTQGDLLFEQSREQIQRHRGPSSHGQSFRIAGGAQALVNALQKQLDETRFCLNACVKHIDTKNHLIDYQESGQVKQLKFSKVILALPLRLAAQSITFTPAIPEHIQQQWLAIPTWMAGHSKIVFVYEKPFWREQNLSGEVFSYAGPLSEIYDGSSVDDSIYALTSFVGLNAHQRKQIGEENLIATAKQQLLRLFGERSRNVISVNISDWASERFTSTEEDLVSRPEHPQYDHLQPRALFDNQLLIAGTEAAINHGGYLEGALESVDRILPMIVQ